MTNKLFEYYKGLSPTGKTIFIIGGLAGVAVTYIATTKFINKIKEDAKNAKAQAGLADSISQLNSLKARGINPSFPDAQYNGYADKIQSQFDGCDTSSPVIFTSPKAFWSDSANTLNDIIVTFKNDADFLSLVNAYGVRTYKGCGMLGTFGVADVNGDLYTAVSDELNTNEIKGINDELAANSITYKF